MVHETVGRLFLSEMVLIECKKINRAKTRIQSRGTDYDGCMVCLFDSEEQYKIHYDAIMSTGYANEITDFRVRETDADAENNAMMIWIGSVLAAAIAIVFNVVMRKRGCERAYFTKLCIPKGQDVKPYYKTSFVFETIAWIVTFAAVLFGAVYMSDEFIPKAAIDTRILVIPAAVIVAEIICLLMNNATGR